MKTWFRDLALRLHIQKRTLATAFTVAGGFVLLIAAAPMPVGAVNPVVSILSSISFAIANFFGMLALWMMDSLIKVAQFNTFIDAPTVEKGWVIVRDVCNMFFIVVLLLMAFGTVFRIEEYQYKHALSKLLIMAVLVNFSKSICGLAIDFSQVVMLTFVNGFKDAAAGNFVNGFKIKEALQFAENNAKLDPNSSGADSQVLFYSSLLAMLSMFITMCVMFIYLGIFLMRIIVLWVLIILSPIAFTLQAFPGKMKEQAHEWWSNFGKYVTIGPVLAFGLWLSLAVMQMNPDPGKTFNVASTGNVITGGPTVGLTYLGQSDVLLSFVVNIAVMVIFLLIAGKSGTLGSGAATSFVSKLEHVGTAAAMAPMAAAAFMGKRVMQYPGFALNKAIAKGNLPAWANPVAVWKAREERRQELRHEAQAITQGSARESYTKAVKGTSLPYRALAERGIESEKQRLLAPLSKEQKAFSLRAVWGKNDFESEHNRNALLLAAAPESHIDDLYTDKFFKDDAEWADEKGNKHKGFAKKFDKNHKFTGYGALTKEEKAAGGYRRIHDREIMYNFLKSSLGHHKSGARIAFDIGEGMKKARHWQGAELSEVDEKTGNLRFRTLEESAKNSKVELSKVNKREQLQAAPHIFYAIYEDPDTGGAFMGKADVDSFEESNRKSILEGGEAQETERYTQERTGTWTFGGNKDDKDRIKINERILGVTGLVDMWNEDNQAIEALYLRSGAKGVVYKDSSGTEQVFESVRDMAEKMPGAGFKPKPDHLINPDGTKTKKKMEDIDPEKQERTKIAVAEFLSLPENKDKKEQDFFTSHEYESKKNDYYSSQEYSESRTVERYQAEHGAGLSANQFARGEKDALAVDFSKVDLPENVKGAAGVMLSKQQDIATVAASIGKVIQEELGRLQSKSAPTLADQNRIANLTKAMERLANPDRLNSLTLYNSGREGVGARRLITHEDQHAMLTKADPNEKIISALWRNNFSQGERNKIAVQIKNKFSNQNMSEPEIRREYFSEGMANETQWGDKSSSAIRLKDSVKAELAKVISTSLAEKGS